MVHRQMHLMPSQQKLLGKEIISYSADIFSGTNNFEEVPIDFLNGFDYPGFPNHVLKLKQKFIDSGKEQCTVCYHLF